MTPCKEQTKKFAGPRSPVGQSCLAPVLYATLRQCAALFSTALTNATDDRANPDATSSISSTNADAPRAASSSTNVELSNGRLKRVSQAATIVIPEVCCTEKRCLRLLASVHCVRASNVWLDIYKKYAAAIASRKDAGYDLESCLSDNARVDISFAVFCRWE